MDGHLNEVVRGVQSDGLEEMCLVRAIRIPAQVVGQSINPTIQGRVKFGHDALLPFLLADLRDDSVLLERILHPTSATTRLFRENQRTMVRKA